jgi:hypothetical protein
MFIKSWLTCEIGSVEFKYENKTDSVQISFSESQVDSIDCVNSRGSSLTNLWLIPAIETGLFIHRLEYFEKCAGGRAC